MEIEEFDELRDKLAIHLEQENDESNKYRQNDIHLTDLTMCLDQAYFSKIEPQEHELYKLLMFVAGHGHHDHIEGMFPEEDREVGIEWNGIHGTVDAVWRGSPVEIKTNYAQTPYKRPAPHYIEQLQAYCAMMDVNLGYILVFYVNAKDGYRRVPEVRTYSIEFTDKELTKKRIELDLCKKVLEASFEDNEQPGLGVEEKLKWLCNTCNYSYRCEVSWIEEEVSK